jgi:biotin operon repressor
MQGDAVDASSPLMVSVSEIARMKGVSKQAVAKRVDQFEARGDLNTVRERGQRMVPLAVYDRLVGETTDFSRQRGAIPTPPPADRTPEASVVGQSASSAYTAEQARKMRYDADLREIELGKELGKILLVEDVEQAMTKCAEIMVRRIEQLVGRADDLAAAVARDGSNGARIELRDMAKDLRKALADAMKLTLADDRDDGEDVE